MHSLVTLRRCVAVPDQRLAEQQGCPRQYADGPEHRTPGEDYASGNPEVGECGQYESAAIEQNDLLFWVMQIRSVWHLHGDLSFLIVCR